MIDIKLKEKIAKEIAIDRQIRILPTTPPDLVRGIIGKVWDHGTSRTDEQQRTDYRRDAEVALKVIAKEKELQRAIENVDV